MFMGKRRNIDKAINQLNKGQLLTIAVVILYLVSMVIAYQDIQKNVIIVYQ